VVKKKTAAPAPVVSASYNAVPFAIWLSEFKTEALGKGIPSALLEQAFRNISPNDTVVRLDRKQPEGKITFTQYKANTVNARRIAKGKALLAQHAALLKAIEAKYHVPPQIVVALWGIETEYGAVKGNFSLIQSLSTLAYEGRRADFFRGELMNALRILQDERVMGATLTGSWAGAMGHCQFMPSTYLKYAVDWDGDGHRDIWNSVPDALASIASYLHGIGWDGTQGWGIAVKLPQGFPQAEADLYKAKPLRYWRDKGVATRDGKRLPGLDTTQTYVMFPGTPEEGAYMVTQNYHKLLEWNRSRYFANAVGALADAIQH